ncbi:MAG: hypothetical protein V2A78_13160, partial [bacterium]
RSIMLRAVLFSLLFVAAFTGVVWADAISPSQEQEFIDARGALEAAREADGGKFAPSYIKQAEDFLKTAGGARSIPDAEGFSRASRLARAYAELAKASAELNADVEILAATDEALLKAKAEIDRLKK